MDSSDLPSDSKTETPGVSALLSSPLCLWMIASVIYLSSKMHSPSHNPCSSPCVLLCINVTKLEGLPVHWMTFMLCSCVCECTLWVYLCPGVHVCMCVRKVRSLSGYAGSVVPWTYCTPALTNAHALAAQIPLRTSLPCPILRLVSVHQACFYVCSCSVCTWNHLEISWIMMRSPSSVLCIQ